MERCSMEKHCQEQGGAGAPLHGASLLEDQLVARLLAVRDGYRQGEVICLQVLDDKDGKA